MKTIHENLPLLDPTLCRRNKKKKKKRKKKNQKKKNLGRKHKTSRPTDGMPNKNILAAIGTIIPVSSANCERGVSRYNAIKRLQGFFVGVQYRVFDGPGTGVQEVAGLQFWGGIQGVGDKEGQAWISSAYEAAGERKHPHPPCRHQLQAAITGRLYWLWDCPLGSVYTH